MNRERSSIKLKIFLSSALLFFAACSSEQSEVPEPAGPRRKLVGSVPTPPWQIWGSESFGDPAMADAEEALRYGELEYAAAAYGEAYNSAPNPKLKEEAVLRRAGTLLKMGSSQKALQAIAAHAATLPRGSESVGERLSLVAAFAYWHQRDTDQALAWFSQGIRTGGGKGRFSARAREEAPRLISSLSVSDFERYNQRWTTDLSIGSMFIKERLRRAQGGQVTAGTDKDWFLPATYGGVAPASQPEVKVAAKPAPEVTWEGSARIGVILPLSGEYAENGLKARQGIELAIQQSGLPIEIVVADSKGDPEAAAQEYERLATTERVSIVLGPLLVKSAERIAARSQAIGVPFIAFTKRSGLPQLGPAVFRLGATVENQVDELLAYAKGELGVTNIAVIAPDSSSGQEFANYFKYAAKKNGVSSVQATYRPGNADSVSAAISQVSSSGAKAVFVPDTLELAFPVLEQLQHSSLSKAVLLGHAQWNDPIAVRGYGQLLEGAVCVTPFYAGSNKPEVVQFVAQFRERYKSDPELLAAQGYDAAKLAISALAQPSKSAQDVISRLEAADGYGGVTGKLSVDADGEIHRRMSVLRLKQGEIIEVMSGGSATGFYLNEQREKQG